MRRLSVISSVAVVTIACAHAAPAPTAMEARAALRKAVAFFSEHCGKHGGYVWRYSRDLKLSEGEGETGPDTIWVQPPGTPSVGEAFLEAYDATGDRFYLDLAAKAARALVRGQLKSGGWYYRIEFDPGERRRWGYRDNARFRASKTKKNKTNITTLDDDTTPAALRFLIRTSVALGHRDKPIRESIDFALDALFKAQRPNGGWGQNWHRYPEPADEAAFPVIKASYPEKWSRRWLNDWRGKYFTNDNVMGTVIDALLLAWKTLDREDCEAAALRGGDFLILAQMPDPQPGWAQQYDERMHPVWDRKFEPPAISSHETEEVIATLMALFRATREERFLAPVPKALAWLRKSRLPDGKVARFYELKTNRPLYFDKQYQLTYHADRLPTHYGFRVETTLESLEREFAALKSGKSRMPKPDARELAEAAQRAIIAMDSRGAWIDKRGMRGFRKASQEGVYQSETFVENVRTLCRYLAAMGSR